MVHQVVFKVLIFFWFKEMQRGWNRKLDNQISVGLYKQLNIVCKKRSLLEKKPGETVKNKKQFLVKLLVW